MANARSQIDARKWVACKLLPRKYGDRVSAAVSGADGGAIKTEQSFAELKDMSDEDLWTMREILMRCAGPEEEDEGEEGGNS